LKWGLVILFSFYIAGITLFFHEHNIGNERVVHSHLFADADHKHSASGYFLIEQLNNFASTADILSQFDLKIPVVTGFLNSKSTDHFSPKFYFLTISLRAPPASVA
jgi:hypothetical protein